jgi:hypothetical protein
MSVQSPGSQNVCLQSVEGKSTMNLLFEEPSPEDLLSVGEK